MARTTSSQAVAWFEVRQYVAPFLQRVGSWPMAGTPQWCELADDHPAKAAALYDAAQHWALRVETCQTALAETSHDVSGAADWKAIATEIQHRHGVYIPREVA
jgi:hypothetical protein